MLPSFAFDIWTVVILLFLTNILLAILYYQYFRASETISSADRIWLISRILLAASWLGFMLRGTVPDLISVAAASGFLYAGFSCECLALLSFARSHLRLWQIYYLLVTGLGTAFFFWQYQSFSNLRIFAASFIIIAIYFPAGVKLLITPDLSRMCRTLGYLIIIFSVPLFLRMANALDFSTPFYLWTPSVIQSLSFLNSFLFTLASGIGFLLISRENLDKILFKESRTDYLTGLPNRRAFFPRAEAHYAYCRHAGQDVAYMVIDIDKFKDINDRFGHDAGDTVLRHFSNLLDNALRSSDLSVRLGGDEFGVLLPATNCLEARRAADRLASQPHTVTTPAGAIHYTLSIGITFIPGNTGENIPFEALCHCGDQALYEAKNQGRNQISYRECISS